MDGPVEIDLEPADAGRRSSRRRDLSSDVAAGTTGSSTTTATKPRFDASTPSPEPGRTLVIVWWRSAPRRARRVVVAVAVVALVLTGFVAGRTTAPTNAPSADPADPSASASELPTTARDVAPPDADIARASSGDDSHGGDAAGSDVLPGLSPVTQPPPALGVIAQLAEGQLDGANGGPLLPAATGLVVEGVTPDGTLVRIDLDTAELSVVTLPLEPAELADGGYLHVLDVFSLVGSRGAARAVVVDTKGSVRSAPDAITAGGGTAFRGPGRNDVWVYGFGNTMLDARRLLLVDLAAGAAPGDGDGSPTTIELDWFDYAVGDGSGGVLVNAVGGWFLLDGVDGRFVTSGQVVGSGASHLVVVECATRRDCETVVIDRATAERRSIAGRAVDPAAGFEPAAVAPDGSALLSRDRLDDRSPWRLVDLEGGRIRTLVSIWGDTGREADPGGAAWSDDGRFALFTVRRQVWFHDRETTVTRALVPGRELPDLVAFGVRRSTGPAAGRRSRSVDSDQRGSSSSSARSGPTMSWRSSATIRLR